jgi:O-antigen ligase
MKSELLEFPPAEAGLNTAQRPASPGTEPKAMGFACARFVLVATLFAGPLAFGAVQAWAWSCLIFASLAVLLLWAVCSIRAGSIRLVWSPLYLPLSLFVLLAVCQYFFHATLDHAQTKECVLKVVADALFFFLALQLAGAATERQWSRFGLLVSCYAFGVALFAVLQFFSNNDKIYWLVGTPPGEVLFGPYVSHNHYAGLMEMLIPISAGFLLSQPKSLGLKPLLGVAVVVPVASVLLSGSRGGMLSLLGEAVILGIILWRWKSGHYRLALLGSLAMAVLVFLWMDPGTVFKLLQTISHLSNATDPEFAPRRTMALDSFRILRDYPWLGTGLGSFDLVYTRYRRVPSDLDWDHAHDDYAEALAETGLVGAVLIVAAIALFLATAFANVCSRLDGVAGWIQVGAAIGCCGLLLHSFTDFNFHIPANAMWFAACAALAQSRGEPSARSERLSTRLHAPY